MSVTLEVEVFDESSLPYVQDFECGEEPWAIAATDWIKGDANANSSALQSIQRGNSVWLYFAGPDVVGFGSLGTHEWPDMPPDGEREKFAYIPQLAVASRFQGKPKSPDRLRRYSGQILSDLIWRASQTSLACVGLSVHERNAPAINLYKGFEFRRIGKRRDYIRMARLLK